MKKKMVRKGFSFEKASCHPEPNLTTKSLL
jgi:hypothetical protein